jgi:predicted RNA binding protein YcfA (HicA-like mRNA interferase family)
VKVAGRGVFLKALERAGWNVQRESHVVLGRTQPERSLVITFSDDDDHDIGATVAWGKPLAGAK